jgi:hypothetical protein
MGACTVIDRYRQAGLLARITTTLTGVWGELGNRYMYAQYHGLISQKKSSPPLEIPHRWWALLCGVLSDLKSQIY